MAKEWVHDARNKANANTNTNANTKSNAKAFSHADVEKSLGAFKQERAELSEKLK